MAGCEPFTAQSYARGAAAVDTSAADLDGHSAMFIARASR